MKIECATNPCVGCPIDFFMKPEEKAPAAEVASEVAAAHPTEITDQNPQPASRKEMEDWVAVAPSIKELEKATDRARSRGGAERIVTAFRHMRAGRCHPGTLKLIREKTIYDYR